MVIRPLSDRFRPRSLVIAPGTHLVVLQSRPRQVALHATGVQANLFSRFFRVIRSYANSVGKPCDTAKVLILLDVTMQSCANWDAAGASWDAAEHAMIVAAVGSAEDPEKMLDQAVNEMQNDLVKLRQASAQVPIQLSLHLHHAC